VVVGGSRQERVALGDGPAGTTTKNNLQFSQNAAGLNEKNREKIVKNAQKL
jgi:hypothetical protein